MLMSLLSYPEAQLPNNNSVNIIKQNMELTGMGVGIVQQQQQQQPQLNHINKLLSTAAAGNGLVGDVDALLQPIVAGPAHAMVRLDQRPERNLWRLDEMLEMLHTMQQINAIELLNDKSIKSDKVFRNVEELMNKKGFCKKSHVQIWTKWKFLKSTYTTSKRNGFKPKMISPQIYDILHNMLSGNSTAGSTGSTAGGGGDTSECGNSRTSMDGDSSNSARMVIAGVEGNYNVPQNKSNADSEEENGLAHPIFGFRLGLVKQEPLDTGYESMANGVIEAEESQQGIHNPQDLNSSATAHLQFRTEIKQEPAKSPATMQRAQNGASLVASPAPVAVPNTPPVSCPTPALHEESATNPRLPTLRIATFAKESALHANDASNSMPPATSKHHLRIANVQTACDMIQPRKPYTRATPALGNPCFQKEIMVQPRASAMHTAHLRLKNVAMRKSPYALRAERSQPDLEAAAVDYDAYNNYATAATSSNQIRLAQKRALQTQMMTSVVKKRPRQCYDSSWSAATATPDDEDEAESEEDLAEATRPRFSANGAKKTRWEKELFSQLLKEFSTSLRDMQRELIGDFFTNQMQLARKEHDFQMKQDMLMLKAFKAQTEEVFATVRAFMGQHNKECKEQACQTETETRLHEDSETQIEHNAQLEKKSVSESTVNEAHLQNGLDHNDYGQEQVDHTEDDDNDSEEESTESSGSTEKEHVSTQKQCEQNNGENNEADYDNDDDDDDDDNENENDDDDDDDGDDDDDNDDDEDDDDISEEDYPDCANRSPHCEDMPKMLKFKVLPNRTEATVMSRTIIAE